MRGIRTFHTAGILQTHLAIFALLFLFSSCGGGGGGGAKGVGNDAPGAGTAPPTVGKVFPSSGPVTGGEHVIVKGADFIPEEPTQVIFDGQEALNVNVIDPETIVCVTPPHPRGVVSVTVINRFGSYTLPGAFNYTVTPSILWLDYHKDRNRLKFMWKLSEPGDSIIFFRGDRAMKAMEGDTETFVFEENRLGFFRYTVALYKDGYRVDQRDVLVDLGRVSWDPPANSLFSGFYVYVAEAVHSEPYLLLPYDNPSDYDVDCGKTTEVSFRTLYQNALIGGKRKYYVAVSTYYGNYPGIQISNLSPPIEFYCFVEIGMP